MTHQPIVAWTEIPVTDMKKASAFYGEVFGWNMEIISSGPNDIAVFNGAVVGAGGHLYPGQPGESGWKKQAANLLKSELKRKGVTYAQLADLFGEKEVNVEKNFRAPRSYFTACPQLGYVFANLERDANCSSTVATVLMSDLTQLQGPEIIRDSMNSTANITVHKGLVAIMQNMPMPTV